MYHFLRRSSNDQDPQPPRRQQQRSGENSELGPQLLELSGEEHTGDTTVDESGGESSIPPRPTPRRDGDGDRGMRIRARSSTLAASVPQEMEYHIMRSNGWIRDRQVQWIQDRTNRRSGHLPNGVDGSNGIHVDHGIIPPTATPAARTRTLLSSNGVDGVTVELHTATSKDPETTMASSTTSTATPGKHPFERRLEEVKLSKTDLNSVIMDYLISEGYPSAAQKFASEANIQPTSGVESIQERVEIREAIHAGDIQTAIEKINELNPMLLDRDHALHFALLRLQLVELIRNCADQSNDSFMIAVKFAETHLASRAPTNSQFLDDLERTMALLIYDPKNIPAELAPLLEPQLRKDVAQSVNEALLREQGERTKAKLFDLVRLRAWSERKAREANKDLPEHLGLGLDGLHNGPGKERDGGMHSNGEGEAMVA